MNLEQLVLDARAWIAQDPDPETRAELEALISEATGGDSASLVELQDCFSSRVSFGTAGLRGALAAGPNRINRVVIAHAAAGIAQWVLDNSEPEKTPSVVIGFDGRKNSQIFASDSAEIFAGFGITAHLMPEMTPTPVLAFAVKEMRTSVGIMVTASHNPPGDNGYKVYQGFIADNAYPGAQITSPTDKEIAEAIERVAEDLTFSQLPRGPYKEVDASIIEAYIAKTAALVPPPESQLNVVYTAMHGVGSHVFSRVISAAGFDAVTHVDLQDTPDASFPTVRFPNPEETEALELACGLAQHTHADLIIAHDPDADRLAIAIPDAHSETGFRRLTGNEVGCLLGWWAVRKVTGGSRQKGTLSASLVSTPALAVVARDYKLDFQWTLSGFKWVARVPHLVFGFEEALGYLVNPENLKDKDGISAALAFLSLASELSDAGSSVEEHLNEFSTRFGHFASNLISHRLSHPKDVAALMARIRKQPPTTFGTIAVLSCDDLLNNGDGLPAADVLRFWLADGSRVMMRPSGTEPKLKIYIDVVGDSGDLPDRKREAAQKLKLLTAASEKLLKTI